MCRVTLAPSLKQHLRLGWHHSSTTILELFLKTASATKNCFTTHPVELAVVLVVLTENTLSTPHSHLGTILAVTRPWLITKTGVIPGWSVLVGRSRSSLVGLCLQVQSQKTYRAVNRSTLPNAFRSECEQYKCDMIGDLT